jgi:hypothetical protein
VVGFVEGPAAPRVFATLVLTPRAQDEDMARVFDARSEMALRLLTHMGVIPSAMKKPA